MTADPFEDTEDQGPHWPEVRAWLQAHPDLIAEDRSLLEELGLKATGRNVVEFGRAALTRLEDAVQREADARKEIEGVARANFAAQTQTHVAALDLMEARNHSDLARRLDAVATARFGLAGAAVALEKPGGVPFGWKALASGQVDGLVGADGLSWLGPWFDGLDLFGPTDIEIQSVALIRMAPFSPARPGICAFGSPDPDGFTPRMGCELVSFLTRVLERTAERWPILN